MHKSIIVMLAFVVLMVSFQQAECFVGGGIINRPGSKRSQVRNIFILSDSRCSLRHTSRVSQKIAPGLYNRCEGAVVSIVRFYTAA